MNKTFMHLKSAIALGRVSESLALVQKLEEQFQKLLSRPLSFLERVRALEAAEAIGEEATVLVGDGEGETSSGCLLSEEALEAAIQTVLRTRANETQNYL